MAEQFVVSIRDADLKTEIETAVSGVRANLNSVSSTNLVVEELEAHLIEILNDYRRRVAIDTAISGVTKETSLS